MDSRSVVHGGVADIVTAGEWRNDKVRHAESKLGGKACQSIYNPRQENEATTEHVQ